VTGLSGRVLGGSNSGLRPADHDNLDRNSRDFRSLQRCCSLRRIAGIPSIQIRPRLRSLHHGHRAGPALPRFWERLQFTLAATAGLAGPAAVNNGTAMPWPAVLGALWHFRIRCVPALWFRGNLPRCANASQRQRDLQRSYVTYFSVLVPSTNSTRRIEKCANECTNQSRLLWSWWFLLTAGIVQRFAKNVAAAAGSAGSATDHDDDRIRRMATVIPAKKYVGFRWEYIPGI